MAVLESSHEVSVPFDAVSGLAGGRAEHRPFIVVKEIDQATPALYRALVEAEPIDEAELQYWAPKGKGGAGAEIMRYSVRLRQARLVGVRFVQPDVLDADLRAFPEAEELSFVYEQIEWCWTQPGAHYAANALLPASASARPATKTRAPRRRG
jgi:type VI secretion system secreted protein Hcp